MSKSKILIIEDERSLSEILSYNLANEGFEVLTASDGIDGLRRAQNALPDLIVLDLMLPGIDGLQICRQLRSDPKTQGIRILMLTAKAEEVDEIVGFNMGADDYVAKPFKIKPLISRIKALLRRPSAEQSSSEVISVAGIEVDRTHHTAKLDGQEMQLTPTEFKMLWTMMRVPAGRTRATNCSTTHAARTPTLSNGPSTCMSARCGRSSATRATWSRRFAASAIASRRSSLVGQVCNLPGREFTIRCDAVLFNSRPIDVRAG